MRKKVISFILAIGSLTALSFGGRQIFAYDGSAADSALEEGDVIAYDTDGDGVNTTALKYRSVNKFNVGDRIRTTVQLWVRNEPLINDNKVWLAPKESTGVVIDGPASGSGYTWWRIDYDVGIEGWSAEGYPGGAEYLETYTPSYTTADSFQYPLTVTWEDSQDFGVWNSAWEGYHLAEDVLADVYTPVYASANGKVQYTNTNISGYGSVIIIEHQLPDDSYVCTLYGHLSRSMGLEVNVGESVSKDQLLGYLGDSSENGGSEPHIHFGIRKGGYSTESDYCSYWLYVGYSKSCSGCTHEQYRDMWYDPTNFINSHLDNFPVVNNFNVTPISVTLGNSFTISYTVSDDIGLNRVELWRAVDDNGDGEPDWPDHPEGYIDIHYPSGQTSHSDSFSDTPLVADTYWYGLHVVDNAEQLSFEPNPPGPLERTVTSGGTTPPICVIELLERDRIDPIDEITVDHWFDIYVGDSTDDVGISEVRFSSDDSQDGIPQGTWTQWYDWDVSTGPYGWYSMNKRMSWAFATSGRKEVWVELKDSEGQTSRCYDNIRVPCVCTSWQDQGCGQGPCFETQMYQTRICDSPGCAVEGRCINHMSCEPGWRSPSANGKRYSDWTSPENAYSSNNQYAVANSWASSQDWYNFGFDIPDSSIIEGIEVGIEGTGNGDDYVGKVKCWLYWRGFVLGGTETDYIEFPATEDSLRIVGGPSDLWGWDFWSPEDIVGEGFGVRLSTGLDWHTARIDSIQARIYYRVCPDVSYDGLGLSCLVDSWLQQCNLGNDY
ncbi:MAG: M23 family metallopeptidase, partial [Planctomycetota bacterium]